MSTDNRFVTLLNLRYQLWLSLKANRKDQEGRAVIKITVFPTVKLLSHSDKLGLKIPEHFAGETNTNLTFTNCPYLAGQKGTNLKPPCAHQKMKPAFTIISLPHLERIYTQ